MSLLDLVLLHRSKIKACSGPTPVGGLHIDTCQREIWLGSRFTFSTGVQGEADGIDTFVGESAYQMLLSISLGLESRVRGESDIFGQIKQAWASALHVNSELKNFLNPVFQTLFTDAKEIRAQHLQGVGTGSYGSIARTLLNLKDDDRVLLIGAGQLSQSIRPFFDRQRVTITNRSATRLLEGSFSGDQVLAWENESLGWSEADAVILCVPPNPQRDLLRCRWILERKAFSGRIPKILHLGAQNDFLPGWAAFPDVLTLTDIFNEQKAKDDLTRIRLSRAEMAVKERAGLRIRLGSLTASHSWEDLFA